MIKYVQSIKHTKLMFPSHEKLYHDPDPLDSDHQESNDGLTDSEAYQLSSDSLIEGRAHPLRQDVFVEVDWVDGHNMLDAAKWKVGTRFYEHDIWLHIDDGIMGGGKNIGNINNIATTSDTYTDLDDIKSTEFANKREGKFHYCVFGYKTYGSDGELHLGHRWGADMLVSDKYMDTMYIGEEILETVFELSSPLITAIVGDFLASDSKSTRQACVFMHELGHTLDLDHPTPAYKETHSWIPGISKLPSGYGPLDEHTCMNYWYIMDKIKYTSEEWNYIELGHTL